MDLFDSKRQERLEAARKASIASKEAARNFLIEGWNIVAKRRSCTTFEIKVWTTRIFHQKHYSPIMEI